MKKIQHLFLALAFGLISAVSLVGCGGGSTSTSLTGDLELAVTDAEEDFLTYKIGINAINLTKANGGSVSVLPLSTEVDFVQYQELSELFAVLSVPAGSYTGVTLQLDYSNADIVIQDDSGNSYSAKAVDSDGNDLGQLDVALTLNGGDTIEISPFKAAQLTLDLDLAASNTIESFTPAVVTVEPFMIGTTYLDGDREHRVRGLLKTVDTDASQITLNVRPMRIKRGEFGQFSFNVNDDTRYEVNGVEYTGTAGITAMSALDLDTPVVGFGKHDDSLDAYLATEVHAGSSVAWSGYDILKGVITARSGNSITIQGGVIEPEDSAAHFRKTTTLLVGDNTDVTAYRLGDSTIANLSVGQRVLALGQFENDQFDATAGLVRMQLSSIVGQVTTASPLVMDLSYINKRPDSLFDFSGTGTDASNDADPAAYEINSSTLDISSLQTNELIQVRGYPTAFGSAPADFDALSIVNPDFSSHNAKLMTYWDSSVEKPLTVESGTLTLNTAAASKTRFKLAGVPGNHGLGLTVATITGSSESGRFAVHQHGFGIDIYRDYDSFADALAVKIAAGAKVSSLTAAGKYSDSTENLVASYLTVNLDFK